MRWGGAEGIIFDLMNQNTPPAAELPTTPSTTVPQTVSAEAASIPLEATEVAEPLEPQRFDSLPLDPKLLRAIVTQGYLSMTPIQSKAIPLVLEGRDVMGAAQTGTGKTAAFSIPLLQKMLMNRTAGAVTIAQSISATLPAVGRSYEASALSKTPCKRGGRNTVAPHAA